MPSALHRRIPDPLDGDLSGHKKPLRARAVARVFGPVAVAIALAGCAPQASGGSSVEATQAPVRKGSDTVVRVDEGQPRDGGLLVFGVSGEPDGFNPSTNQFTVASHMILSSMLETLVVFDANRATVPYLAERFDTDDGGTTWTIQVKKGIRFHDGSPLDAAAVKANLEAQQAGIGGITMSHITSMATVDDRTLEVSFERPWAAFPATMAGQVGVIVSPASIASGTAATAPVGTGPFTFDRWDRGSEIVVKRNDAYWQAGKPHLDGIEFRIVVDPTSRQNALRSGDLDMIMSDQAKGIAENRDDPNLTVIVDELGDAENVMMNQAVAPFDNANARRALVLATDSAAIADALGGGTLEAVDQPFADGTPYHTSDPGYPGPDQASARAAAEKYKAETGKPLAFTLTTFAGETDLGLAQALQAQWAAIGIEVEIKSQEQASAIKDLIVGNYQASLNTNFGYPDPDFNYLFLHSSHTAPIGQISLNFVHLENEGIDKLLDRARTSEDVDVRTKAYQDVVRALNADSTYVWLYRYVAAIMADAGVHGLQQVERVAFYNVTTKTWYGDLWLDR